MSKTSLFARIFFRLTASLVVFFALGYAGTAYAGTLTCTVRAGSCNGGETAVFRMYATSNSHAEMPSQTNYNNIVCCGGVTGISNTCSGTYATVAKLSGLTNAHVEQGTQSLYANSACLSVPSGGSVVVGYQANNCTGYDTTVASMGATPTNSHVGDANAYVNKICASATGTPALAIGVTSGSQATTLSSGATAQFVNSSSCTSGTNCSLFTINTGASGITLTSIKLTETGTVNASTSFSNVTLYYDTTGTNGAKTLFGSAANFNGSENATISGSLALSAGTTYYFYVKLDLINGSNDPAGGQTFDLQIASNSDVVFTGSAAVAGAPASLAGSTTVVPQITNYTNSTDSALNYAASCSGCGARIGPSASAKSQTIVISGYGFGADPGLGSRDTATNKVEVGTHTIADGGAGNTNVSAWADRSITIITNSGVTGDDDASWGTNYGGAAALKVVAGGQAVPTSLNFYVFPQVTSLTVCNASGFPVGDNAREYDPADAACPNGLKEGEVTINGFRFGSASSGGYVRILGCSATTCSSPSDSANTTAWSNTAITVQVPSVIADNVYTGSLVMQQGSGSNNKTHTYTASGFRILPRISSLSPSSGSMGDAFTVNGNHLCQNNATCPVVFGSSDKVVFYNAISATVFTSWSNSAMVTQVPSGVATGNVTLTSNGYPSNASSFTLLNPTPSDPTLGQFRDSSLSQTIAVGATDTSTPTYFALTMSSPVSGGTLYSQFEFKPVGTSFVCAAGACATAVEGVGKAGPGPVDCTNAANSCFVSSTFADNVYHWQGRVRYNKGGTDYYSNWVSFGGNSELAADFKIDTQGPGLTAGPSAIPGTNSCAITWNTDSEQSTSQVQYNKTGSFVTNCATNHDCTVLDSALNFTHSVTIQNLDSNTTYYYRVRSVDGAGVESISGNNTCLTSGVTQPAKTTEFYITGENDPINSLSARTFSVVLPESSYVIKSAFVEITGISADVGTNNITVGVNAQATQTFVVPSGVSSFHIVYPVDAASLNLDPATNELDITPSLNTHIVSAKIIVTYAYTP